MNTLRTNLIALSMLIFASYAYALPSGPVVGQTTVLLGDVSAVDQDGDAFSLSRGGDVYAGITLTTGDRSFVKVIMEDGTKLSLGEDGEATISEFTYDPAARIGSFAASVARGASVYASGEIGTFSTTREHSTITTPHAVVGIRGSIVQILVTDFTVVRNQEGNITLTSLTTGNVIVLDVGEVGQLREGSDGKVNIKNLPEGVIKELNKVILQDANTGPDSVNVSTISLDGETTIIASPITP